MSEVELSRAEKIRRWGERQRRNPDFVEWMQAQQLPEGADPILWAFENAPDQKLALWAEFDPLPSGPTVDPLAPLAVEAAPTPTYEEVWPAVPSPLDGTELLATAALPTAVSWFPAAGPGEYPTPLVKIPGSKRWLCPAMAPQVIAYLHATQGTFYEPFAGSAAVGLAVATATDVPCIIADANEDLMAILAAVRDTPKQFSESLQAMVNWGISEDHYHQMRNSAPVDIFNRALRALYLARLAFNGLWRVNRHGGFNVPYGKAATRAFPSEAAIRAVSRVLQHRTILVSDYAETIGRAGAGDLIYGDPPYSGAFVGYTKNAWRPEDDIALSGALHAAADRGATVILSSPSASSIWGLYDAFHRIVLPRKHIVAARAEDRTVYPEAIYTNAPELIDVAKTQSVTDEPPPPEADDQATAVSDST